MKGPACVAAWLLMACGPTQPAATGRAPRACERCARASTVARGPSGEPRRSGAWCCGGRRIATRLVGCTRVRRNSQRGGASGLDPGGHRVACRARLSPRRPPARCKSVGRRNPGSTAAIQTTLGERVRCGGRGSARAQRRRAPDRARARSGAACQGRRRTAGAIGPRALNG